MDTTHTDKRFVFIRTRKCAGTSLKDYIVKHKLNVETIDWDHLPQEKDRLLKNKDNYYIFTVVRNPFDRLVSTYSFATTTKGWVSKNVSFTEFAKLSFTDIKAQYGADSPLWYHLNPFMDFLPDEHGSIDYIHTVLSTENFAADFAAMCQELGWPVEKPKHQNSTYHKPYWEYYNEETRQVVEQKYAQDLEAFGYSFEAPQWSGLQKIAFTTTTYLRSVRERLRRKWHPFVARTKKKLRG